mmetsp:Transcript_15177/g.34598  ORF Transcript_15177/g.34598 Transcript_15177/m.34598 type:complete len:383 (+) Transcript_15177:68-1216(+)
MVLGGDGFTSYSFLDYQVFMLLLAGLICVCLAGIEIIINRFQALPVIFPGMFTVRDRRFYVFDADISDGGAGKKIRSQAKLLTRMTVCLLLSYLWQNCILITKQSVGTGFPHEQCQEEYDCFASELHFLTLITREYTEIDCTAANQQAFEDNVVVTCMSLVHPQATEWLMHLAIAHSLAQLHFKCFELISWIAGKSGIVRRLLVCGMLVSFLTFVILFFTGVLAEFITSWLSFVMALSMPTFCYTVWRSGQALKVVWHEQDKQLQHSIELHLSAAFRDIESVVDIAQGLPNEKQEFQIRKSKGGIHRRVISSGVDRIMSGFRALRDKTSTSLDIHTNPSTGPPSEGGTSSRMASTRGDLDGASDTREAPSQASEWPQETSEK